MIYFFYSQYLDRTLTSRGRKTKKKATYHKRKYYLHKK